jgi:hypothetical protein
MKDLIKIANFVLVPFVLSFVITLAICYSCSANCFKSPLPYFLFVVCMFGYVAAKGEAEQTKAAKKNIR